MAHQAGPLQNRGTIGNITFAQTKYGYLAKMKRSASKSNFKSNPALDRVRDNCSEFGRAGKAGKLLRETFKLELKFAKDYSMLARLVKVLVQIAKTDPLNPRGLRSAAKGDLELLENFEFNGAALLSKSFGVNVEPTIDRVAGTVTVSIPSFNPLQRLEAPDGISHYRVVCAAAEIDFDENTSKSESADSGTRVINNVASAPLTLTTNITPGTTKPVFLIFGIQFIDVVNGFEYPAVNGEYNALTIIKVDA